MYSFSQFSQLQIGYGKDMKSTWKTELDKKFINKLQNYLKDNSEEWTLESEIEGVSCHCVQIIEGLLGMDMNTRGGKRLNFKTVRDENDSSKCKLKKIRHQVNKLMFLDICEIPLQSSNSIPDLRVRFQTEHHEPNLDVHKTLAIYFLFRI